MDQTSCIVSVWSIELASLKQVKHPMKKSFRERGVLKVLLTLGLTKLNLTPLPRVMLSVPFACGDLLGPL